MSKAQNQDQAQTDFGQWVIFSTADWDEPYWTNKQHMAMALARRGYRVIYIESVGLRAPTLSRGDLSRIWRRLAKGLAPARHVHPNIWVLSPLVLPFAHGHWLVKWLNQGVMRVRLGLLRRRAKLACPHVLTYHPFMLDTIANSSMGRLVYHCIDDFAAVPGIDAATFNRAEAELTHRADHVFVSARHLVSKLEPHARSTVHFHSNVGDFEHFSVAHAIRAKSSKSVSASTSASATAPSDPVADIPAVYHDLPPGPRAVYVGVLSDFKIDLRLLLAVAQSRPNVQFVLIGTERVGQHDPLIQALIDCTNVHAIGHVDYRDLPQHLAAMDVGLLPQLLNDYTRSMFPMKFYEYLTAGLPVVSTALDFTRDVPGKVMVVEDADTMATAIDQAIAQGHYSLAQSRTLVGDNTWEGRLDKMLAIMDTPAVSGQ